MRTLEPQDGQKDGRRTKTSKKNSRCEKFFPACSIIVVLEVALEGAIDIRPVNPWMLYVLKGGSSSIWICAGDGDLQAQQFQQELEMGVEGFIYHMVSQLRWAFYIPHG